MNIQLILREWLYDNPHDILHKVMTIVIKFLQQQYLLYYSPEKHTYGSSNCHFTSLTCNKGEQILVYMYGNRIYFKFNFNVLRVYKL